MFRWCFQCTRFSFKAPGNSIICYGFTKIRRMWTYFAFSVQYRRILPTPVCCCRRTGRSKVRRKYTKKKDATAEATRRAHLLSRTREPEALGRPSLIHKTTGLIIDGGAKREKFAKNVLYTKNYAEWWVSFLWTTGRTTRIKRVFVDSRRTASANSWVGEKKKTLNFPPNHNYYYLKVRVRRRSVARIVYFFFRVPHKGPNFRRKVCGFKRLFERGKKIERAL